MVVILMITFSNMLYTSSLFDVMVNEHIQNHNTFYLFLLLSVTSIIHYVSDTLHYNNCDNLTKRA